MNLDWLGEWVAEDPASRVPLTLTALGVLFVLPLIGFARYMWRMGADVRVESRFPPSGYRVIGKQPPVTGDAAATYARLARMMAVFLVIMAFVLVFQLWRLATLLTP
jgi:hypothetical protein